MQGEKLLQHPAALCNIVRRLAVKAGHETLRYYDESGFTGADIKSDGSPVTIADRAAEAIIEAGLKDILPDVPVIGEEAVADGRICDLAGHDYFWLVDALDGTREFVSGSPDYTVNIALVHKGEPVLGVIFAPVPGELYAAHGPDTAIRWMEDTGRDKPVNVRRMPSTGLTVAHSRHHGDNTRMEKFLESYKVEKILRRGSSLKLCQIASGKADLYVRMGQTCEWDTAAGDAILRGAGGYIADLSGNRLTYGRTGTGYINPEFMAAGAEFFSYSNA